jgi:SAM-dependent methyltransferase
MWKRILRLRQLIALKRCPFFDEHWYLSTYPDVREAGIGAARHYLEYGAAEGRDPNCFFSTSWYLRQHPELANSGINPLLHFVHAMERGKGGRPRWIFVETPPAASGAVTGPVDDFLRIARDKQPQAVLEVGTSQVTEGVSKHHRAQFPWVSDGSYVRLDLRPGPDVDVVGDLHCLPPQWSERFDCFFADAVFEHLQRPWIAAREVARILAPGGLFFVRTVQTFPIHGHPGDFFRFTREALRLIFEDAGLVVDYAEYNGRSLIIPPAEVLPYSLVNQWNADSASFILVDAFGHKPPASS